MVTRLMFALLGAIVIVAILASGQWVRPDWAETWLEFATHLPIEPGLRTLLAGSGSYVVFVAPLLAILASLVALREFLRHLGAVIRC
jgi:hypothetical protein